MADWTLAKWSLPAPPWSVRGAVRVAGRGMGKFARDAIVVAAVPPPLRDSIQAKSQGTGRSASVLAGTALCKQVLEQLCHVYPQIPSRAKSLP
jgi:hypothetical protein